MLDVAYVEEIAGFQEDLRPPLNIIWSLVAPQFIGAGYFFLVEMERTASLFDTSTVKVQHSRECFIKDLEMGVHRQ